MKIKRGENFIHVSFERKMKFLSWSIINGGSHISDEVFWARVHNRELPQHVDPLQVLKNKMKGKCRKDAICFLTSAHLDDLSLKSKKERDIKVSCLATVGMGNSLRIGDRGDHHLRVGTINLLVKINKPLSLSAQIEAMTLITEARTMAVLEENIPSLKTGLPSTGTGTDCIAFCCEIGTEDSNIIYSGKHTLEGSLIGQCTYEAVKEGVQNWKLRKELKEKGLNIL